jgi:hypothetical protein
MKMRVNVYAEEMTDRVELVRKVIEGHEYVGIRFYLYLPTTVTGLPMEMGSPTQNFQGPFLHRPGDDDSAAVTFWGKRDSFKAFEKALFLLADHYGLSRETIFR